MKLALFDVDGTLVNSEAMITASLASAFQSEAMAPPPRETMLSIVGLSLVDAMRKLAPGEEDARHHRLADAYKAAFWKYRDENAHAELLFDGALDLLQTLRRRDDVILGVATGKSRRGVDHLFQRHGFDGWFATIQTSDSHPSKPHPSMVLQALAETGLAPEDAIVIGDTSYDIGMARAAGAGAIGVTWGNQTRSELENAGAHYIVSDFNALLHSLDVLWQEQAR